MKKIIGLSAFMFLLSFGSFAQSLELAKLTADKNKNCTPTKECAEKMGMTLAECKKLCAKTCSKTSVASVSMESSNLEKKACTKTCAKTKVASASAENQSLAKTVSIEPSEKKKECKSKCKKTKAEGAEKKSL